MKKNNVKKIKKVKIVSKIEKKQDRPLFPRPAVFADKSKYNRKREKRNWKNEV